MIPGVEHRAAAMDLLMLLGYEPAEAQATCYCLATVKFTMPDDRMPLCKGNCGASVTS
jgi:hypothetical protein